MFNWFKKKKKTEDYTDGGITGGLVWNGFLAESGIQVTPRTAINFGVAYACVRAISETVASLPFPVYERLPNGGKQRLQDHPVWRCLNISPDGILDAFQWREACNAQMLQWGNCYNEIETFRNGDINLHLIPASSVTPIRNPDGSVAYKVDGSNNLVPSEKMLHWAMLGDGLTGYSPIRLGRNAIGLAQAMESFGSKFFANGCSMSGILSHPGELKPSAAEHLKKELHARHSGENANRLMLLQDGLTYTPTSVEPEAAQFLASRTFQVQEICRLFRLDPSIIGEHSRSTFTNSEQQFTNFVVLCIRPHCRRIESELNRKIFRSQDTFFAEHLIDGLMRGDSAARTAYYNGGLMNGWLNPNGVREMENMNPYVGGDVFFHPLNMARIGADGEIIDDGTDDTPVGQDPPEGTVPPITIDENPTGDGPSNVLTSSLVAVQDSIDRMVRREIEAIKQSAKHPNVFLQSVDSFYDRHLGICERAIEPSLNVWSAITHKTAPNIAESIVNTGRDELIALSGEVSSGQLMASVEKWAENRLNLSKTLISELSA